MAEAKGANKVPKAELEARKKDTEASENKRNANYAAAKERCDKYNGDVKDRCIAVAKVRFNVK